MRQFWVYILASRSRQLYVGVTNDLAVRLAQHAMADKGFTARYRITRLVYFEHTEDAAVAITREKQIKGYRRSRKIQLITFANPAWNDLGLELGLVERTPAKRTADSSLRSE